MLNKKINLFKGIFYLIIILTLKTFIVQICTLIAACLNDQNFEVYVTEFYINYLQKPIYVTDSQSTAPSSYYIFYIFTFENIMFKFSLLMLLFLHLLKYNNANMYLNIKNKNIYILFILLISMLLFYKPYKINYVFDILNKFALLTFSFEYISYYLWLLALGIIYPLSCYYIIQTEFDDDDDDTAILKEIKVILLSCFMFTFNYDIWLFLEFTINSPEIASNGLKIANIFMLKYYSIPGTE